MICKMEVRVLLLLDGRYVCKSRLNKMLDQEYGLLEERLNRKDHKDTRYFVFARAITTA